MGSPVRPSTPVRRQQRHEIMTPATPSEAVSPSSTVNSTGTQIHHHRKHDSSSSASTSTVTGTVRLRRTRPPSRLPRQHLTPGPDECMTSRANSWGSDMRIGPKGIPIRTSAVTSTLGYEQGQYVTDLSHNES